MKRCIKTLPICARKLSTKQKQWLWGIGLWCSGLLSVGALSYVIKWVMGV